MAKRFITYHHLDMSGIDGENELVARQFLTLVRYLMGKQQQERKFMIPNESGDSASDRTDDENEKTIMHRFLSVISACYQIDIIAYRGHDDNSVNAEGDKREKNEL